MNGKIAVGEKGENIVADFLKQSGYAIIGRNYHSRYGEVDIIAVKSEIIAFVEVKTRKQGSMVKGAGSVTAAKQQRIIKTAVMYMQENEIDAQPRFDVAVVEYRKENFAIDYLENCFDGDIFK